MSGYAFTPLPDVPRVAPRREARFDRRLDGCVFGRLTLTYRAEQPIHVGAGHKVLIDGDPVRAQMRSGDYLIAPGATWKGVTRARFEAISRACAGRAPKKQRRITSQTYDGYSAELHPSVAHHPVFTTCRARAGDPRPELCPACALFGVMSRRGRITFADLTTDAPPRVYPMPQQYGPRLHHLADPSDVDVDPHHRRLTVKRLRGRKFHGGKAPPAVGAPLAVEAIPPGAMLTGRLTLYNVTPAELGGLLVALGVARNSYVKLGAGKSHAFGRLAPSAVTPELRDHRGRPLPLDPAACDAAWGQSPDRWADGEVQLRAIHNRGGW